MKNREILHRVIISSALIAALTMTACGQSGTVEHATKESKTDTQAAEAASADSVEGNSSTDESDVAGSNTSEDENTAQDSKDEHATMSFSIASKSYYEQYTNGASTLEEFEYKPLFRGKYQSIVLNPECESAYPELYKTLDSSAKEYMAGADNWAAQTTASAKKEYEDSKKNGYDFYGPWYSDTTVYVSRADRNVVSIYDFSSDFEGGVHGMYGAAGQTIDVATGQKLNLSDVVTCDDESLKELIIKRLKEQYPNFAADEQQIRDSLAPYKLGPAEDDYNYQWYLDPKSLHIIFNPYEIGSYADGMFDVSISYEDLQGKMAEQYQPIQGQGYISVANLSAIDESYAEGYQGMHLEYHAADYDEINNWTYADKLTLVSGDQKASFDLDFDIDEGSTLKSYDVVTADGREYIYVTFAGMSDGYTLAVFDITGGLVKAVDTTWYHLAETHADHDFFLESAFTDPENIILSQVSDDMGTMTAHTVYAVDASGMPQPTSDVYTVDWCSDDVKSKIEITGIVVDDQGQEIESGVKIPAGTHFKPVKVVHGNYVDCLIDDGRIIRLKTYRKDYDTYIDEGMMTEVFDGLVFAG